MLNLNIKSHIKKFVFNIFKEQILSYTISVYGSPHQNIPYEYEKHNIEEISLIVDDEIHFEPYFLNQEQSDAYVKSAKIRNQTVKELELLSKLKPFLKKEKIFHPHRHELYKLSIKVVI